MTGTRHLPDANWFHITGITPALSEAAAQASLEAVEGSPQPADDRLLRPQLSEETVALAGRHSAR